MNRDQTTTDVPSYVGPRPVRFGYASAMIIAAFVLLALAGQPDTAKPAAKPAQPAQPPTEVRKDRVVPDTTGVTLTFEGDLFDGAGSVVATSLTFAEGPLWRADNSLVICDLSGNTVYSINLNDGRTQRTPGDGVDVLRKPSGSAAGAALDKDGQLVFSQFDGKVTRLGKDGKESVIAESIDGKKLNAPNDVVTKGDGSIYFTDFSGGRDKEHVEHPGVYRLSADGKLELMTKDVEAPNGLAFSPDEKTLYVAAYRKTQIMAFDVAANGTLSNPRVFATAKDPAIKGSGTTDGVKADLQGNVWTTGPGGVWIFGPDGKRIGRVVVSTGGLSNLAFGGADGKTVFFTGGPRVLSARLKQAAIKPAAAAPMKPASVAPAAPAKSDTTGSK